MVTCLLRHGRQALGQAGATAPVLGRDGQPDDRGRWLLGGLDRANEQQLRQRGPFQAG
jgi:hypothetical protein